ncbi:MAG TPA: sulfatase-like hydrolase/transferase, partial [Polyangiaceae bacterium]|nr:sulfatase-like hydrolase/transferase [Polyangiaceae bacterium]
MTTMPTHPRFDRDLLRFWLLNALAFVALSLHGARGSGTTTGEGHLLGDVLVAAYALTCALPVALAAWGLIRIVGKMASASAAYFLCVVGAGVAGALLVIDMRFFLASGVHLYSPFVEAALRNVDVGQAVHIDARAVWGATLIFAMALTLEAVAIRVIVMLRGRLSDARRLAVGTCALFMASAFVVLGFRQRVLSPGGLGAAVFPIDELLEPHLRRPNRLVADYAPPSPAPPLLRRPSVLFLVFESLRGDALTPDRMPILHGFAEKHGCLQSRLHFSSSHLTHLGIFSLLYGVNALHYDPFSAAAVPSFPLRAMREAGYWVGGIASSKLIGWRSAGFMTRQLDPYIEPDDKESYVRDRHLVDLVGRMRAQGALRDPYFLFLFFDSTHFDYSYPVEFERELPVLPPHWAADLGEGSSEEVRIGAVHRYHNSISYVDSLIGELLSLFHNSIDKGDLVIVATGDHGEEFWDQGMFGHGAPRFINSRVHVPLVVCLPGVDRPQVNISGHVDVMSTLLDYAGMPRAVTAR